LRWCDGTGLAWPGLSQRSSKFDANRTTRREAVAGFALLVVRPHTCGYGSCVLCQCESGSGASVGASSVVKSDR